MTKEEMLKAYLKDDYFKKNGYFKDDSEIENLKWIDYSTDKINTSKDKLIAVIKIVIDGIFDESKKDVDIKKSVNQFLNE